MNINLFLMFTLKKMRVTHRLYIGTCAEVSLYEESENLKEIELNESQNISLLNFPIKMAIFKKETMTLMNVNVDNIKVVRETILPWSEKVLLPRRHQDDGQFNVRREDEANNEMPKGSFCDVIKSFEKFDRTYASIQWPN